MSENKKRKRALSQKAKESVEPWQTASSEGKCQCKFITYDNIIIHNYNSLGLAIYNNCNY